MSMWSLGVYEIDVSVHRVFVEPNLHLTEAASRAQRTGRSREAVPMPSVRWRGLES